MLLPEGFVHFASERSICISMAVSIHDVCKRDPDRGVDLILSVSVRISYVSSLWLNIVRSLHSDAMVLHH